MDGNQFEVQTGSFESYKVQDALTTLEIVHQSCVISTGIQHLAGSPSVYPQGGRGSPLSADQYGMPCHNGLPIIPPGRPSTRQGSSLIFQRHTVGNHFPEDDLLRPLAVGKKR